MATTITTEMQSGLPLLVWLSPAFPVGAFAYSHGLEWAVEMGDIRDAESLGAWLVDILNHGAIWSDAVLLAAAWRAPAPDAALELNALALALAPSRERHLETSTQGTAFLAAITTAWPAPGVERFQQALGTDEVAYPIIVGVAAVAHGLPLLATLEAFALAALGNLVSAVLRLGPIGQSDAQCILADLCPTVRELAARAATSDIAALGSCAWRTDIASMRHETQYSRLFRS